MLLVKDIEGFLGYWQGFEDNETQITVLVEIVEVALEGSRGF